VNALIAVMFAASVLREVQESLILQETHPARDLGSELADGDPGRTEA